MEDFKMKTRIFALLICVIMLLSSCDGGEHIAVESTDAVTTAEPATEAPSSISLSGYKVIRSQKASNAIVTAAVEFKKTLESVAEGLTIGDDWYNKNAGELPAEALEILIGDTNRPESIELKETLLADDFAIKYFPESRRLAIIGGDD